MIAQAAFFAFIAACGLATFAYVVGGALRERREREAAWASAASRPAAAEREGRFSRGAATAARGSSTYR